MPEKAITLCMINYKGGVGKTTGVFNLAAGLRFLSDKRVLMIDLDPQCSLTNLCLKAYTRDTKKSLKIEDLRVDQTVNSVVKKYLNEIRLGLKAKIDLTQLIMTDFYSGEKIRHCPDFDIIPATMFDTDESKYPLGLDDLEVEIAMQHLGKHTMLNHITLFSRFFHDTSLDYKYDFIIFDCPPANSLITQNALVVSDFYLVPTIMDDMSTYGIAHLHNLVQNTIFRQLRELYGTIIEQATGDTHFKYLKRGNPQLLGVFESLLKTGVDSSLFRTSMAARFPLFSTIIYNHIDTARTTGSGLSAFSVLIDKDVYSPHVCYGRLVEEFLSNLRVPFDGTILNDRVNQWF
jgi:cellulose biosynthesis protein BcsQ